LPFDPDPNGKEPVPARPPEMEVWDSIIIGSGPAGCTAALYNSRADLKTLVVAGYESGGQLMLTSEVENYPGYPDGVQGPEMMADLRRQAERFGAKFVEEDAKEVDFSKRPFKVKTDTNEYVGRALILATGSSAMWLGLESETRLMGKGISACATCDGFFFKGMEVVVVGGGDTAMEEALFLTKFATKVTVLHRRDAFRASKIMQDRVLEHPKIEVLWNTEVIEILGEDKVSGVRVARHPEGNPTKNIKDMKHPEKSGGEVFTLECQGYFVAIGHKPNTELFRDVITMDDVGYVVTEGQHRTYTNVPGVFAAGDVQDHRYRQAITAAGSGCAAAIDLERWLDEQGDK
jgi:thioredoxin reductase (NADPH)